MKLLPILFILTSCSGLFYQPSAKTFYTPDQFNVQYEEVFFKSLDGTQLNGWILKHNKKMKRKGFVIQFHGNGENISTHFLSLAWLTNEGYDVFTFDYRGYRKSEGYPEHEGVHGDALAALNFAWKNFYTKGDTFIVYGQSLGGVIALRSLMEFKHKSDVSFLVMDSSFISFQDIAANVMRRFFLTWPFSPLAYLFFSDKYSAEDYISQVSPTPLLVIHGKDDRIVPFEFGEEIYQKASKPKWFWPIEEGRHINGFFVHKYKYRKKFLKFIEDRIKR